MLFAMYRNAYDPELKGRAHVDGDVDKVYLYWFLYCKVMALLITALITYP